MDSHEAILEAERAETAGDFVAATAAYQTALTDPDLRVVGSAQFGLGRVAWRQGQLDVAKARFEEARATALRANDEEARARAENGLGLVHYGRGEYVQARASLTVARDLSRDPVLRAKALLNLGIIANIEGDYTAAQASYTRSRAAFQQAQDEAGEALALHNLGMLNADLHNWDDADDAFRACLELCERLGDRPLTASVLVNRSEVKCARLLFDDAITDCDLAISIAEQIGAEVQRGEALRWKGHALSGAGRLTDANRVLREALLIARRTHVKLLEAESARDLGSLGLAQHDIPTARKWLAVALDLFEVMGAQRDAIEVRDELERIGT